MTGLPHESVSQTRFHVPPAMQPSPSSTQIPRRAPRRPLALRLWRSTCRRSPRVARCAHIELAVRGVRSQPISLPATRESGALRAWGDPTVAQPSLATALTEGYLPGSKAVVGPGLRSELESHRYRTQPLQSDRPELDRASGEQRGGPRGYGHWEDASLADSPVMLPHRWR